MGIVYDLGGRGDGSFNDLAARGLEQVRDRAEVSELTPARGGSDREELLRLLAGDGYGLVVAVGSLFAEPLGRVARDFPSVSFALVDAVVDAPNVASLVFADAEGAFLMGAAAALRSGGAAVGFVGGVDIPVVRRFASGFEAGVAHVDPGVAVETRFLSSPPDFGGFRDPARAREVARGMYERGARVVFHAAGGSGIGVFEAARDISAKSGEKVWGIGVDVDQRMNVDDALAPYVLTSMLKRVDLAVENVARDFLDGRFSAGTAVFDVASGGVGFATGGDGFGEIERRITGMADAVEDGSVAVPTP